MIPRIQLEPCDDGVFWLVLEDAFWVNAVGRIWKLSKGRRTDLASIPAAFQPLVGSPGVGKYRVPAAFHDEAYATPGVLKVDADLMLREFAMECGTPRWIADLIYDGVRVGGESSFVDDQKVAAAMQGALTPAV